MAELVRDFTKRLIFTTIFCTKSVVLWAKPIFYCVNENLASLIVAWNVLKFFCTFYAVKICRTFLVMCMFVWLWVKQFVRFFLSIVAWEKWKNCEKSAIFPSSGFRDFFPPQNPQAWQEHQKTHKKYFSLKKCSFAMIHRF